MTIPMWNIKFPLTGTQPKRVAHAAVLYQREYQHDVVDVRVRGINPDSLAFRTGTPVLFDYGFKPSPFNTLYGYIDHTAPAIDPAAVYNANDREVGIIAAGASYILKDTGYATYYNQTAVSVAQSIASTYHLRAVTDSNSLVWPVIKQAGMSFWELLVYLAKKIGFTVYVDGVTLHFRKRSSQIVGSSSAVPQLVAKDATGRFYGDVLHSFCSSRGSSTPAGGSALRQVYGVDPRTNTIIYSAKTNSDKSQVSLGSTVHPPAFADTITNSSVTTMQEANSVTQGKVNAQEMYLQAQAETSGHPFTRPGQLVSVLGMSASEDGYWYVTAATHRFTIDRHYTLELELGRDSVGVSGVGYPAAGTVGGVEIPANAALNGNVWVAA